MSKSVTSPLAVQIKDLSKRYSKEHPWILKNINLEIEHGDTVLLIGPSGSGKTTLIHLIAGLDAFEKGEIDIHNIKLKAKGSASREQVRGHQVGIVFQHHLLPPGIVARDVVASPLLWTRGYTPTEALKIADDLLDRLQFTEADRKQKVQNLSGGQRQRVAFARAIAPDPPILLADEPIAQLDEETGKHLIQVIEEWARDESRTLILSSHAPIEGLSRAVKKYRVGETTVEPV